MSTWINASERGLLGIALHPNFPATRFVYLYYTESSAAADTSGSPLANRVYRYTWNGKRFAQSAAYSRPAGDPWPES